MREKWTRSDLIANHKGCKKVLREIGGDCYDKMEIALVDLLLKENKQLRQEKDDLKKKLKANSGCFSVPKRLD